MRHSPLAYIIGLSTTSIQTRKVSSVFYPLVLVPYVVTGEHDLKPMMICGITLP